MDSFALAGPEAQQGGWEKTLCELTGFPSQIDWIFSTVI